MQHFSDHVLQDRDDLHFGITLALHIGTSPGQNYREIPVAAMPVFRGTVTGCATPTALRQALQFRIADAGWHTVTTFPVQAGGLL